MGKYTAYFTKSINGSLTNQLFLNFLNCKLFISSSIFSKPVSMFHMKNSIPSITATIVKILSTKDALAYCSPKIPNNGPANVTNALFVGSTAELSKLIKAQKKQDDK